MSPLPLILAISIDTDTEVIVFYCIAGAGLIGTVSGNTIYIATVGITVKSTNML